MRSRVENVTSLPVKPSQLPIRRGVVTLGGSRQVGLGARGGHVTAVISATIGQHGVTESEIVSEFVLSLLS